MNRQTIPAGPDPDAAGETVEDPSLEQFEANVQRAWEIVDSTMPTSL